MERPWAMPTRLAPTGPQEALCLAPHRLVALAAEGAEPQGSQPGSRLVGSMEAEGER